MRPRGAPSPRLVPSGTLGHPGPSLAAHGHSKAPGLGFSVLPAGDILREPGELNCVPRVFSQAITTRGSSACSQVRAEPSQTQLPSRGEQ